MRAGVAATGRPVGLVWFGAGGGEEDKKKKNVLGSEVSLCLARPGGEQKKRRCVGLLQGRTTGGKEKWLGNEDHKR